jgi:hypothetical protein
MHSLIAIEATDSGSSGCPFGSRARRANGRRAPFRSGLGAHALVSTGAKDVEAGGRFAVSARSESVRAEVLRCASSMKSKPRPGQPMIAACVRWLASSFERMVLTRPLDPVLRGAELIHDLLVRVSGRDETQDVMTRPLRRLSQPWQQTAATTTSASRMSRRQCRQEGVVPLPSLRRLRSTPSGSLQSQRRAPTCRGVRSGLRCPGPQEPRDRCLSRRLSPVSGFHRWRSGSRPRPVRPARDEKHSAAPPTQR